MIKLYNTLSHQKDPLPEVKKLNLFVCGPTVYDDAHIGHARTYIFFDFLVKYLRSQGHDVFYLQNITDIDDKIIKRAAETGVSPVELAEKFTKSYREDMAALGVDAVSEYAPATKFIPEIVGQVERLIQKGFAYKIDDDGWYFDISKDASYGKLSGRTVAQAEDGVSRIDDAVGKRNKGDFCLWKFSKPGEPTWESASLGTGRPGWHIEDTAITEHFFGPSYDIHGGAMDLKFPHHEAEMAQQTAAAGIAPEEFVKIWIHTGFLTVNGEKMSKSLGNFVTIKEFLKKYPPEVLRYLFLGAHYRSPLNFTLESADAAKNGLERIYYAFYYFSKQYYELLNTPMFGQKEILESKSQENPEMYEREFLDAIEDDLNTPKALAVLHGLLNTPTLHIKHKLELLKRWDGILGLKLGDVEYSPETEVQINGKIEKYKEFRANKQFTQSDALRKEIEGLGFSVRDLPDGNVQIVKRFF